MTIGWELRYVSANITRYNIKLCFYIETDCKIIDSGRSVGLEWPIANVEADDIPDYMSWNSFWLPIVLKNRMQGI